MSAEQRCPEPLELDFSREPYVRQYEVAFDFALQGQRGQLRTHEQYLSRLFGSEVSSFIVYHAMVDAHDITHIPEPEVTW